MVSLPLIGTSLYAVLTVRAQRSKTDLFVRGMAAALPNEKHVSKTIEVNIRAYLRCALRQDERATLGAIVFYPLAHR